VACVKVMFVTPDRSFLDRIRRLLYARPEVHLYAECSVEYPPLSEVRREHADVLLIDGEWTGDLAVKFLRRVTALGLPTRTLVLQSSPSELRIAHILQCGGAGCLARDCEAPQLIRAIQAVHGGEMWASRKVLADALQLLRVSSARARVAAPEFSLSRREREIVDGMTNGMTNKEIARLLGISDMTVKTHAHNIFSKLDVSGRLRLVARARDEGRNLFALCQIQAPLPAEPLLAERTLPV
jgi:DNA-binding NarL/FixJ family response regulator